MLYLWHTELLALQTLPRSYRDFQIWILPCCRLGLLSIALFIAGFGFKMGLVPFHMWLPDTYEGAPAPVTALLAAGTKKAGFAAALRVVIMGAVALSIDWTLALGIVAIMTMTVGNIAPSCRKTSHVCLHTLVSDMQDTY